MKKLLLLPIVLFAITSCETSGIESTATSHLYAVGNNGNGEAYITKDGVSTSLGAGYFVLDLFVDGNDVYTSGNKDGVAAYTKNGILTVLGTSTASYASNIYVDGDDVYVVGKKDDHPAYWKNGVVTILDTNAGFKGMAYDITVANGNVYIAGYQHNFSPTNPITNILYWENETMHTLYSAHVYSFNWLGEISIAVDGTDVYMAVNERDHSLPTLNGNVYLITNGLQETLIDDNSEVHDIFIYNSDIYLCGGHIESGVPSKSVIWKNGNVIVEKDNEFGTFASVFVADDNIFAVGLESNMVSPEPLPLGTRENHGTTLINNVFSIAPDFGSSVFGSGYMAVVVTQ